MTPDGRPILALDFGGTKLSAGLALPEGGGWLAHERQLSPAGADASSDLRIALDLARTVSEGFEPVAVGVSFGGPVWAQAGTVKLSHHVPGWEGVPLARELENHLGIPAVIENDGIIAALGEYRYGAGQGLSSLLYMTVSTGVGGGFLIDGEIVHGADGMAGHVGHIRLEPDGPPCVCGSRGCLEAIASGPSIVAEAQRRIERERERAARLLAAAGGDAHRLTGKLIAELAAQGDAFARELMERAGRALGIAIGSAANLLNPQRILVGGGVSKSGPVLWEPLQRLARETAMPEVSLDLQPAGLGDDAPLWGAVALAERLGRERPRAAS